MTEKPHLDQGPWLLEIVASRGISGLLEEIAAESDLDQRRALYANACKEVPHSKWQGKNLDQVILLYRAAIQEFQQQSSSASDPETASQRLDGANILSYNLSADLAPCWPGDDEPRSVHHLQEGRRAAEDCLRWREELEKGPGPFNIAWWARGIHCLALGDLESAIESFQNSLAAAVEMAEKASEPTALSPQASFSILLSSGYLGLARSIASTAPGENLFDDAVAAFNSQIQAGGENASDAGFGRDQLQEASKRLASPR